MNVGAVPWYPAAEASEKLPTSPSENTSRSYAGPSAASTLDSAKHGFVRHNPYQGTVLLSAADMDAVMSEDDRSPTSPCVEVRFRDGSHRSPPPPYRTHAAEAFLQQHHHLHATSSRKPVPEQMPVDPSDWEPYVSPSLRKPKGSYTAAVEAIATPRTSTEEHANVAVDGAAAPYRAAVATKLMAEESATKTSAEMVPLPRSRRVNATATSHEVRGPAVAAADAAKPHPSGASSTPTTTNGHHVAPASEPAQTVLAYTTKELGSPTTSGGLSSTFVRSVKGSSEGSDGGAASGGPTPVPRGRRPEEVPRAAAPSTRPARAKRGGNKSEDGWVIVGGRKGTSAAAAASLPAARTTNTLLQLVSAADKAAAKKKSVTESSPRSSTTAKTLPPKNSARPVESEVARPTRAKAPETEEEATHARQRKAKEPATTRPARSSAKEVEELFEATLAESCAPSPSAAVEAAKVQSLALLSIPIASGQTLEEVVGLHTQPRSGQSTTQRGILQLVQRSLGLGESPNAKALLLQRAIQQLSDPFISKNPALCCVVLIEASDCFLDLERSLQCCHQALQIAEGHGLLLFEMLARLAITRALARVIDITNSREHLQRAAHLALQLQERAALGWVALQLGITLELSGNFSESLAWYAAAEKLAISTHQSRLQCDVLCCQGIAYYAVGEMEMAQSSHQRSLEVLQKLPRSWRQRPLQNFVQLKLQAGDMRGALDIHQEELLIAREQGDAMAISRCVGSIALTKKYLGWYEEAAEAYMEELATCSSPDARQAVESLTGAASCYLLSGHTHKALEYSTKAAHQALASNEHCTIAKALVELAAVELQRGCRDRANDNVMEALEAISRVDPTERQQYLVKATLCELEWRVSSILQRLAFSAAAEESSVEAASDKFFEALQYCDLCNVPNTVDVHRLLMRRLNMYLPTDGTSSFANASATPASLYLGHHLLSKSALLEVMSSDMMRHRKLVCYSLPWTEESLFLAFVVSLSDDGELVVRGHVLELSEEATCLLVNTNALNTCFDAPMATLGPLSDALAPRFYGDTPLWPQHYSKIAYDYEAKVAGSAAEGRLGHDAEYCLRVLYDALIRPLAADVAEDVALRGLTFVADGIFTRLPFHAFHDGERYLTQRLNVTTCSSLALLSMLYASHLKRVAEKPAADADADAGAKLSAHVVDISVHAETWEATSAVHVASASLPMEVAHTTIDANLATSIAPTEETSSTDVADDDDHITAHVSRLLRAMESQHKDRDASNCLFRAVHRARGGVAAAGAVLELNLPAQPEVREDYCGAFTTSDSLIKASYSLDAAITWDLHDYAMVVCSGCGTYSGLSIHETGVPVYRALQYAGAQRLLLPVGSRIAAVNADAPTSIATAAITACAHATSVAEAIRLARCAAIDAGLPLQTWAALTQCGLP